MAGESKKPMATEENEKKKRFREATLDVFLAVKRKTECANKEEEEEKKANKTRVVALRSSPPVQKKTANKGKKSKSTKEKAKVSKQKATSAPAEQNANPVKRPRVRTKRKRDRGPPAWSDPGLATGDRQKSFRAVSTDFGTMNMGYCDLLFLPKVNSKAKLHFLCWEVVNLCAGSELIVNATHCLLRELAKKKESVFGNLASVSCTSILLEDQPPINTKTFAMSYAAFGYYAAQITEKRPVGLHFINSNRKLDLCHRIGAKSAFDYASDHAFNKALAINAVERVLHHFGMTPALEWFQMQEKRDDLADSFLQALAFYEDAHPGYLDFELLQKTKHECRSAKQKRRQTTKARQPAVGILTLDRGIPTQ